MLRLAGSGSKNCSKPLMEDITVHLLRWRSTMDVHGGKRGVSITIGGYANSENKTLASTNTAEVFSRWPGLQRTDPEGALDLRKRRAQDLSLQISQSDRSTNPQALGFPEGR